MEEASAGPSASPPSQCAGLFSRPVSPTTHTVVSGCHSLGSPCTVSRIPFFLLPAATVQGSPPDHLSRWTFPTPRYNPQTPSLLSDPRKHPNHDPHYTSFWSCLDRRSCDGRGSSESQGFPASVTHGSPGRKEGARMRGRWRRARRPQRKKRPFDRQPPSGFGHLEEKRRDALLPGSILVHSLP